MSTTVAVLILLTIVLLGLSIAVAVSGLALLAVYLIYDWLFPPKKHSRK